MKLIFSIAVTTILFIISCQTASQKTRGGDKVTSLANAYYTNGLYEAAVAEYLKYINEYDIDEARTANTYYAIANIYFERINNYNKALEYYLRIKYGYPESKLQGEVSKKIVSCLERLERSADAVRMMEKEAAIDREQAGKNRPGAVVAEIGERKITLGDLEFQISQLPAYAKEQFKSTQKKKEYLNQYILQELLYDSAKRKGLDKDKEILEAAFRAKKGLMAEKILQEELTKEVKIEKDDIELYYMAHKDKYVETDSKGNVKRTKTFEEAQRQATEDLYRERQQQAYQKLLQRLMQAENVKLYEHKIK
jgi:peptidyl-prolyl cis-trans isomerase C